jgi:uncharacterized phiE125 gp8 family phage protein
MNLTLLTDPTSEPCTRSEAKAHIGLGSATDFDTMIDGMIVAARRHVEQYTRRALIRQKWRQYLDGFPCEISLAPPTVQLIDQVQYKDSDGATQTVSSSVYELDVPRQVVRTAYAQSWPSPRAHENSVWLDVWSGYFTTGSPMTNAVPADLKFAVLMLVEDLFEHRGKQSELVLHENATACALMQPYRVLDR